jgi:hypothetical protein
MVKEGSIGKYAVDVILAHPEMSDQAVLEEIFRRFPSANTSKKSVSWYRSKLKNLSRAAAPPPSPGISSRQTGRGARGGIENFRVFSREDVDAIEFSRVLEIARLLREHLNSEEISSKIAQANALGMSSFKVQECFAKPAAALGFQSEKTRLFGGYSVANLRPDYYLSLSSGRGILLEVERGKTLANNMDLLDLWKCHICEAAQYLFLVVPLVRPNTEGKETQIYSRVVHRVGPFFKKGNYVSVYGVVVFAY